MVIQLAFLIILEFISKDNVKSVFKKVALDT